MEKCPEVGGAKTFMLYLDMVERTPAPGEKTQSFVFPTLYHKGKWGFGRLPDVYGR
jgi:hypothetical protein